MSFSKKTKNKNFVFFFFKSGPSNEKMNGPDGPVREKEREGRGENPLPKKKLPLEFVIIQI